MPPEDALLYDEPPPAEEAAGCVFYLATLAVAVLSMGGGIIVTLLAFLPLLKRPPAAHTFNLAAVSPVFALLLRGLVVQVLAAFLFRVLQLYRLAMAIIPGLVFLGLMSFLLSLLLFID